MYNLNVIYNYRNPANNGQTLSLSIFRAYIFPEVMLLLN